MAAFPPPVLPPVTRFERLQARHRGDGASDLFSLTPTPGNSGTKETKETSCQVLPTDPAKSELRPRPRLDNDVVGSHRRDPPIADEQRRAREIDPAP